MQQSLQLLELLELLELLHLVLVLQLLLLVLKVLVLQFQLLSLSLDLLPQAMDDHVLPREVVAHREQLLLQRGALPERVRQQRALPQVLLLLVERHLWGRV